MWKRDFYLETDRLRVVSFDYKYLENYYDEFSEEITRYQYPDPYKTLEEASKQVDEFVSEMQQGRMLELIIISKEGKFIGSMEVFGLDEQNPEVGLWIKKSAHHQGYAYEALSALIQFLNDIGKYKGYIYAVDERNSASLKLVKKFECEQMGVDSLVTESGKKLNLLLYKIYR